jgi:predicted ATPase
VDKLRFDSTELVGRQKETELLFGCLEQAAVGDSCSDIHRNSKCVVFLQGESGVGKTALALTVKDPVRRRFHGAFVSAKYDANFRDNQPFSGIGAVCNGLCKDLLRRKTAKEDVLYIRQKLFDSIDKSHIELLEAIVPRLHIFTSVRDADDKETADVDLNHIGGNRLDFTDPKSAKEILHIAMRRVIRILASRLKVVVMLLDDLQWADVPSLRLMEEILDDQEIKNLMFIGCYRSDEVDHSHLCAKTIRNLKDSERARGNFSITEITVSNLSLDSVESYLSELLAVNHRSDRERTRGLAGICHRRTMGNIYFIKVFLMSLQDSSLLNFNLNGFQWEWNESNIEAETSATDNVIHLLTSKMNKFPEELLLLLKITSCLGNMFSIEILSLIWENTALTANSNTSGDTLESLLQLAVNEMLLEVVSNCSWYRFVHDKVKEAASSLVPREEHESFQANIGTCLLENLKENELEAMIFVVADLLNSQMHMPNEVASLNYRAAKKSMDLSDFASAAHYVDCALQHLDKTKVWDDHFVLALQLYTIGAESEAYTGNIEKSECYCDEVLHSKATPVEKMRVYRVLIDQLRAALKYEESWALSLAIFNDLGFQYPTNEALLRLKAHFYLRETKKHFLPTNLDILAMPFVSDYTIRETISFLVQAAAKTIGVGNTSVYILIICRCVRLTKIHGLSEYAGSAFASFANVLMHSFGDWATAVKTAEAALAIQARLQSNYTKTSTILKANELVFAWAKPLRGSWSGLMEAYRLGVLSGNLEGGTLAVYKAILCQFYAGSSLDCVLEDLHIYIPQMEALRAMNIFCLMRILLQLILNLISAVNDNSNQNTTVLIGSVFRESEVAELGSFVKLFFNHWICYACMHFGEYSKGAEIALEMGDIIYRKGQGAAHFGFVTFPRGLNLYAQARLTRRPKYAKAAAKVRRNLRQWVKQGGVNFFHQLLILDAEDAALRGSEALAKQKFSKAVSVAARSGFIQDAGVANERYALYLISIGKTSDAQYYLNESILCYTKWAAHRKVTMLRKTMKSLC